MTTDEQIAARMAVLERQMLAAYDDISVANDICESLGGHIWRIDTDNVCRCLRCGNEAQR